MAAADSPSRVQISRNAVFSDEIFRSGRAADKLAQITETSASLPDSLLRSSLSLMRVLERGTLGTVEDGQYVQTGPQVAELLLWLLYTAWNPVHFCA